MVWPDHPMVWPGSSDGYAGSSDGLAWIIRWFGWIIRWFGLDHQMVWPGSSDGLAGSSDGSDHQMVCAMVALGLDLPDELVERGVGGWYLQLIQEDLGWGEGELDGEAVLDVHEQRHLVPRLLHGSILQVKGSA